MKTVECGSFERAYATASQVQLQCATVGLPRSAVHTVLYRLFRYCHLAGSLAQVVSQGVFARVSEIPRTPHRRQDRAARETRCVIAKRIITSQSIKGDHFLETSNHIVVAYRGLVKPTG